MLATEAFVQRYDTGPDVTPKTQGLFRRYGIHYRWFVMLTVMIGSIASLLPSTIINVAIPKIMGTYGMTLTEVQWLSSGFLGAATATTLLSAWAVEAFGMKTVYVVGIVLFTVTSLLGGLSTSGDMLIATRLLQGASTGLITPIGMTLTFQVFAPQRRGRAMGILATGTMLAPALGPSLGGVLIDQLSWHYVFFIGVPFGLAVLPMSAFFLPSREATGARPSFDWIGFALTIVLIPALMLAFSSIPEHGWDSLTVLGYFAVSLASGACFVVWELRTPEPMLDLRVFLDRRFVAAALLTAVLGAGLFASTYLVPLFLQTLQGMTPTDSGLLMMPAGIIMAGVFLLGGELSDRLPAHVPIMCGLVLFGLSSLLLGGIDLQTPYWTLVIWAIIGRVGLGLIFPGLNRTGMSALPFHLLSQGSGALNFLRQLGSAFGVNLIAIVLETRTSFFRDAFLNAQGDTSSQAYAQMIRELQLALSPAGLSYLQEISVAMGYLSEGIAAQAGVMGFRDSFMIIGVLFFVFLVAAWFLRPEESK